MADNNLPRQDDFGRTDVSANSVLETVTTTAVIPSINEGDCQLKRDKKAKENESKRGSSIAADIRELTQAIRNETDCNALQQKLDIALSSIYEDIKSAGDEVSKKLSLLSPLLKLPTNPFKVIAWLKKLVVGNILPDYKATIDLIRRIVELVQALASLTIVITEVLPRLEACLVVTIDQLESEIRNAIEKELVRIRKEIEKAIANAICEGLVAQGITVNDVEDTLTAISGTIALVDNINLLVRDTNVVINANLQKVGQNQTLVQNLTGIAPVVDTTSIETFMNTSTGAQYDQYIQEVEATIQLPEPVNSELPVITGNTQVGQTLTCSNGVWTSNGTVSNSFILSFQWMKQGQEIFGANTYQYIPVVDDIETSLYCRVRAENQTNIEEAYTANTPLITFALDANSIPVITGTAQSGQTLTCSQGTWPYTPTTVMYEWTRIVPAGSNVNVQTLSGNNIYVVKSADVGYSIKCKVVASTFRYILSVDTANTAVVV